MSISIGRYEFDGPYSSVAELEEKPGIYAVLHYEGEEYDLIHVAEADNIKDRIELSQSTYTTSGGSVLLAACYTPQSRSQERRMMVEEILREFADENSQGCDNEPLIVAAF